jgi:cytochrome c-type biogenesis protein CcmE
MKKSAIVFIALIGVAIAAIISSYGDASTYESFDVALENPDKEYHVVGTLNKEKERYYDPQKDANYFTFYKSEQVVIIGKMKGNEFTANKILLKCPSKYTDNELKEV